MTRCALYDPESPWNLYGPNPLTGRLAWMHGFCADTAWEQAQEMDAEGYDSQADKILSKDYPDGQL